MKKTHRLTQYEDGTPLLEGRADEFSREWRAADVRDRLVLKDKRPAVRQQTELGVLYFTMHPEAWDRLKRLPRGRPMIANNRKLCEFCGTELRIVKEDHDVYMFKCTSCHSSEVHSKNLLVLP
jgi:predicted acyl esterase